MEDNKTNNYSTQTEEYYQKETERSIKIPEGFVNKVMEKVKTEQAKKKNNIIKWVSAAAAFVIVVGIVAFAPKFIGKLAPEAADQNSEFADDAYGNLADKAEDLEYTVNDSASGSEAPEEDVLRGAPIIPNSEKISEEIDRENMNSRHRYIIKKMTFVSPEGTSLNWYEFYNACIDGTAGNDKDAILAHAKDCLIAFELYEMTAEASQANEIISAIEGSAAN